MGGACWAKAFSNSDITTARKFLMTSSKGLAPKALENKISSKQLNHKYNLTVQNGHLFEALSV